MRKVFTLFFSLLSAHFCLQATVYTVSNDPSKPAQYTSPVTALAAASPGDTLYIYGSPNEYGDLAVDKSIVIIGPGFNTRKEFFYKAKFRFIDFPSGALSNLTVDGIVCQAFRLSSSAFTYSGITLRNLIVSSGIASYVGSGAACGSSYTNWLIENCYIDGINMLANLTCNPISPAVNGFLVRNSVIRTIGTGLDNYNLTFTNCQIGINDGGSFSRTKDCVFNNCIFFTMTFVQGSTNSNNQFNNCLTYQTQSPSQTFNLGTDWSGGATGTANNCIINQNPLWATVPTSALFSIVSLSVPNVWNPVLQGGSPAINAGSDGSDIGVTGGLIPYNYFAEPKLPVIRRYQLMNPVVPANGTVTVNATATKAQ